MTFYEKLVEVCAIKNTTPTAVCRAVGLSDAAATKWRRDGATPRDTTLKKVANHLGIPTADIAPRAESKRCGNCIHYSICSPYVLPGECFPEVKGGCEAYRASADYVPKVRLVELFAEIEKHESKPLPEVAPIYVLTGKQIAELKKKYLEVDA